MKGPKKESYYEVQKTKTKKNRLGHNKKKILVLNCIIIIFKSTLKSGLLLVSGPFKVNGVPVKRVSQSYVIATSLKVNVDPSVAKDIDDAYFKKEVSAGGDESNEDKFFEEKKAQKVVSEKRKTDQAAVDGALMKAIGSVEMMKEYLAAPFTLSKKDKPHNMVF